MDVGDPRALVARRRHGAITADTEAVVLQLSELEVDVHVLLLPPPPAPSLRRDTTGLRVLCGGAQYFVVLLPLRSNARLAAVGAGPLRPPRTFKVVLRAAAKQTGRSLATSVKQRAARRASGGVPQFVPAARASAAQ